MPRGKYERTPEMRAKLSAALRASPAHRAASERKARDPVWLAARRAAAARTRVLTVIQVDRARRALDIGFSVRAVARLLDVSPHTLAAALERTAP